jgi:hypothetical protein
LASATLFVFLLHPKRRRTSPATPHSVNITEVFDNEQRELGFEHAKQLVAAHSTRPLAEIAERLIVAVRAQTKSSR